MPTRQVGNATANIYIDSLRVRSEPNESSNIIGGVSKGQTYRVLNISEDGIWIRLAVTEIPRGWGWVPARFTSVIGDITGIAISNDSIDSIDSISVSSTRTPSPRDGVVTTDGPRLRVRSGPSAEDEIITYVYRGNVHRVLERSRDDLWVRLEIDDQPEGGWVSIRYVELGSDVPTAGEVARALPATATETAVPTTQPASTTVVSTATVTATATATAIVTVTATAIVTAPQSATATQTSTATQAATQTTTATQTATATQSATATTVSQIVNDIETENTEIENIETEEIVGVAVVRTDGELRLRVRAQPDVEAVILGHAYNDRSYSVYEKTLDGTWVRISIPELSVSGWVSTDYLDLTVQ